MRGKLACQGKFPYESKLAREAAAGVGQRTALGHILSGDLSVLWGLLAEQN